MKKYLLNNNCNIEFVKEIKGVADNKVIYQVDIPLLISFLECNGFRKFPISSKEFIPIRLEYGSVIIPVSEYYMKDIVMQYLDLLKKYKHKEQFHYRNYFTPNLITSLQTTDFKLQYGDKNTAFLYYMNGVLKITKDNFELIPYNVFDGYLWSNQITKRDISLPLSDNFEDFCFNKFLWNISGQTQERYNSIISIIGYLLHNFKDRSFAKAIIFTDEHIDSSGTSANGGTGKSILSTALSKMVNICKKEGKKIESNNKFFYQEVETYHSILYFDDVSEDFSFESLYSVITGDLPVEKKRETIISIPFDESPKILISSNYIVLGKEGYSDERRRIDYEFSSYYSKDRTPFDEFGHVFFDEWDAEDWKQFDSLMIYCIQFYLNNGLKETNKINLEINKIIQLTHPAFVEFAESNIQRNSRYNRRDLYEKFISLYKNELGKITSITFNRWIDRYLTYYKKWTFNSFKSNSNYIIEIN